MQELKKMFSVLNGLITLNVFVLFLYLYRIWNMCQLYFSVYLNQFF